MVMFVYKESLMYIFWMVLAESAILGRYQVYFLIYCMVIHYFVNEYMK